MSSEPYNFIFKCKSCRKAYSFDEFVEIVKLWGMICFTSNKKALYGINCSECLKTTIKWNNPDDVSFLLKFLKNTLDNFDSVIPFSAKILHIFGIMYVPSLIDNNEGIYSIPEGFLVNRAYDNILPDEPIYRLDERHIDYLIKIENDEGYKAFPRIAENLNKHYIYDDLIPEFHIYEESYREMINIEDDNSYREKVHNIFFDQSNMYARKNKFMESIENPLAQPDEGLKGRLVKDSFTYKHFRGLDKTYHPATIETELRTLNIIKSIYNEYKEKRNKIDFEINYRDDFFYKYLMKLFYNPYYPENPPEHPKLGTDEQYIFTDYKPGVNKDTVYDNSDLKQHSNDIEQLPKQQEKEDRNKKRTYGKAQKKIKAIQHTARELRKKYPKITIQAIIDSPEINDCCKRIGKNYSESRLRVIIRPVFPGGKGTAGRRSKKSQNT